MRGMQYKFIIRTKNSSSSLLSQGIPHQFNFSRQMVNNWNQWGRKDDWDVVGEGKNNVNGKGGEISTLLLIAKGEDLRG